MVFRTKMEFDPIFYEKLENGKKIMTFRRGTRRADPFEVFSVNGVAYGITSVIDDISLFDYLVTFWDYDGWTQADHAADWMMNHYFKGEIKDRNDPALKNLIGCAYKFRKLSPKELRDGLRSNAFDFYRALNYLLHYLDILDDYKPEVAGYNKSYLEDVQYFLKEIDNDALLFDFEEKLFPSEEEED